MQTPASVPTFWFAGGVSDGGWVSFTTMSKEQLAPPVGAVTDAQILGQQIDGAIIVVRAGETTRVMLRKAARLLSDVNVNILGALLNHVDVSRRGYGRAYYQYYRQHGVYVDDAPPDAESSPSA